MNHPKSLAVLFASITRWCLAVFLITANVGCNTRAQTLRQVPENQETLTHVRNWVNRIPPEWLPSVESESHDGLTVKEWLEEGNALPDKRRLLVVLLDKEENHVVKVRILRTLAYVGDKSCIDSVAGVLRNQTGFVRAQAAATLGQIGGEDAIDPLCEAISDPDWNVHANVCQALAQIGGQKAEDCLRQASENADPSIKECAVRALSQLRNRSR